LVRKDKPDESLPLDDNLKKLL